MHLWIYGYKRVNTKKWQSHSQKENPNKTNEQMGTISKELFNSKKKELGKTKNAHQKE